MDCLCCIYDKIQNTRFWDHYYFADFDEMDNYIGLCEEYGFVIERIINRENGFLYYDVLPEGECICMIS